MSVLHNVFTLRLTRVIFYTFLLTISFVIFPQFASANSFIPGVLQHQTCGEFSVDIYANGTGMMFSATPLETQSLQLRYVDQSAGCAVVQWQSSAPAATQVIFSELADEPVAISLSEENFGYPFGTPQNNAGRADHTAILEGLEPGKVYSYRIVTRPHPTALPIIGEPQILVVESSSITVIPITPPNTTSVVTPIVVTPIDSAPLFDAEKFPIAPRINPDTSTDIKKSEETIKDSIGEFGVPTSSVPSALTAVESAFGNSSKESSLWRRFIGFVQKFKPTFEAPTGRFSLSSSIGLFERDSYIVPTLLFLGLLLLLQQLVLPALKINLKNPLLYWVVGSMVLTGVAAIFMFYYVSIVGIALFLALLAWYLIQNVPEDGAEDGQLKLIDEKSTTTKNVKGNKK